MKDIPEWVAKIVKESNLCCTKCKCVFKKDNLIAVGIQESSKKPHSNMFTVGLYCPPCEEMTIFEVKEMSLVEFAFEILERETDHNKGYLIRRNKEEHPIRKIAKTNVLRELSGSKKRKSTFKSKITKREMNADIRFLKNVKTHEEFLLALGLSPEQIYLYSHKKPKEE